MWQLVEVEVVVVVVDFVDVWYQVVQVGFGVLVGVVVFCVVVLFVVLLVVLLVIDYLGWDDVFLFDVLCVVGVFFWFVVVIGEVDMIF